MAFTEDQMKECLSRNGVVNESVNQIKGICQALQRETGCPDEDVDDLLNFLVARWKWIFVYLKLDCISYLLTFSLKYLVMINFSRDAIFFIFRLKSTSFY